MRRREFLGACVVATTAVFARRAKAEEARLLGLALGYNENDSRDTGASKTIFKAPGRVEIARVG